MVNIINKKTLIYIFLVIFASLTFQIVSAETWEYGGIHQHTGYSSLAGYDGNPDTDGDDCLRETNNDFGYTVAELKEELSDFYLGWLAFSDHSYCLDSSEFNQVKSDCQNAQDASFTCLWGEELSVDDVGADIPDEALCWGGFDSAGHLGAYGI